MMSLIVNNSRDTVSFTPLDLNYTAGDRLLINCTITAYQQSPVITTEVTSYLKHNNIIIDSSILVFDITVNDHYNFSLTMLFTNVTLSNAGSYTCSYFLNNNSFVQSSEEKFDAIKIKIKSEFIFHDNIYIPILFSSFITQCNGLYNSFTILL